MRGVEAQALKNVGTDLGAFLRRHRRQRMQVADTGRQILEGAKLAVHTRNAPVAAAARQRIGIDGFPAMRRAVCGIERQQCVQECGAAARQAGNEDRAFNIGLQKRGRKLLLLLKAQQVSEKAQDVPSGCRPPDQAECRFLVVGLHQPFQRRHECGIREWAPGTRFRLRNQSFAHQRLLQNAKSPGETIACAQQARLHTRHQWGKIAA